jgi:hypothetical protein
MSTVARTDPRGTPTASSTWSKTLFHSRASRWLSIFGRYSSAVEPRSMSRCALWKRYSPASMSEPEIGPPSTLMWRSMRCQPRGRTSSVATSSSSA